MGPSEPSAWDAVPGGAALAGAPLGVAVLDDAARVVAWNARAEALTGYRATEVLGGPDPGRLAPDEEQHVERALASAGGSVPPGRTVQARRHAAGHVHLLSVHQVTPVELADGPGSVVWFDLAGELEALLARRSRLSHALVETSRVEEIRAVVADAVEGVLGGDGALVLRRCSGGAHLHGEHALGREQSWGEQVVLPLGEGGPWEGALDGVVAEGPGDGLGYAGRVRFVPMGPEATGLVLAVLGPHDTTTLAADLSRALADETWVALQRTALVAQLEGKVEILEATHALASSVGLDRERVVHEVVARSAAALGCERAALYLVEGGELRLAHALEATGDDLAVHGEGLGLAGVALGTDGPLLAQDVTRCSQADGPWHADAGTVAVLGLPLDVGERRVGVLVAAHTAARPGGFTAQDLLVGDAVARQVAVAVEHARLYEEQRHAVHQLRELERVKADWFAGLTHDLKGPLTGLLGFVRTLQRVSDVVGAEQRDQYLAIMGRQADRLVALVEDMLASAQVDAPSPQHLASRVDLAAIAEEVVAILPLDVVDRVTVVAAQEAPVIGDRHHLQRLVHNLVDNALVHGEGAVAITVRATPQESLLCVDDDGPGVPAHLREKVFERFEHGGAATSTGLGLFVARGLAQAHGGDVELGDGEGANFVLRLPREGTRSPAEVRAALAVAATG